MALIFYYAENSTAEVTARVLDELEHGLTKPLANRIKLSIGAGDTRTPAFLSLNPNGRVPVIAHNGVAIWESAAITMYLGETFGVDRDEPPYPALGPLRGKAMKWIVWTNMELAEAAGRLAAALPRGTPGAVEEVKAQTNARRDVARCLDILEDALAADAFLAGEAYSLADTHVWTFVGYVSDVMGIDLNGHPNLKAWQRRVEERPALAGK
ncbi:hypothetical protein ANO11243_009720 [Dothideomycetidae sp. 11243]|nr:hypothetical protein ANO11243_009720 [fungal sp. No.11243]